MKKKERAKRGRQKWKVLKRMVGPVSMKRAVHEGNCERSTQREGKIVWP